MAKNDPPSPLGARVKYLRSRMQFLGSFSSSLLSYLRSTTNFKPMIPKPHTLDGLAVELLLPISDFLSLDDILCVSMCNRRLFITLGRKRKLLPPPTASDKLRILQRIERDMPTYFVCHYCFVLHKFEGPEVPMARLPREMFDLRFPCMPFAQKSQDRLVMELHDYPFQVYYNLCFIYVQLVMRRFHCGARSGITTRLLSHTQIRDYKQSTGLFSIEAQICREPLGLCLRIQDIMLVQNRLRDSIVFSKRGRAFRICAHIRNFGVWGMIRVLISAYSAKELVPPREATATSATLSSILSCESMRVC